MKNRIIKGITTMVMILFFSSCAGWLELEPENDLIKEEYWKKKSDVENTLMGAYSTLSTNVGTLLLWGDLRGDMFAITLKTPMEYQRIMSNIITDNYSLIRWNTMYKVINFANNVIANASAVRKNDPSFSEAEYNQMMAEAYFLRSLSYFYLVRAIGDVPLVLEPSESDGQDYFVSKNTEMEILNRIIDDLEAIKEGAALRFSDLTYTKGRATKGAVYALLADIYLWRGSIKMGKGEDGRNDFDQCVKACQIVRSLPYSLVPMNDWFTIFYPGNSSESIFELQFDLNRGQTNGLLALFSNELNFSLAAYASIESLYENNVGDKRGKGGTFYPTATGLHEVWKYVGIGITTAGTDNRRPKDKTDNNYIFYRLADIYLMETEARLLLDPSDDMADDLLRQVKERASVTPAPSNLDLSEVLIERSRELAYEGKRWFDLLRYARRSEEGKNMILEILLSAVSAADRPFFEYKFKDENSYYFPIHQSELSINPNLIQNPFYDFK